MITTAGSLVHAEPAQSFVQQASEASVVETVESEKDSAVEIDTDKSEAIVEPEISGKEIEIDKKEEKIEKEKTEENESSVKNESEMIVKESETENSKTDAKISESNTEQKTENYTVEFTHKDLQYVLQGGKSVKLSEILSKLELSGTPTEVVSSNDELFTAAKENGEWIIKSKKAFKSNETLKVTIENTLYTIKVTDEDGVVDEGDFNGRSSRGKLHWKIYAGGSLLITKVSADSSNRCEMPDYQSNMESRPWHDYVQDPKNGTVLPYIRRIMIGEGITYLGTKAFKHANCLEWVFIPSTVTKIGGTNSDNSVFGGKMKKGVHVYCCYDSEQALKDACNGNIHTHFKCESGYGDETDTYFHYHGMSCGSTMYAFLTPQSPGTGTTDSWTTQTNDKLVIVGYGGMNNYSASSPNAPWANINNSRVAKYNGITSVEFKPFSGAYNPITSIGKYAFLNHSAMTTISNDYDNYSINVSTIGEGAFQGCSSLKNGNSDVLTVAGITSIAANTFKSSGIKNITIPNNITSIGVSAFESCTTLAGMTIPNTVTSISTNAFHDCTALTTLTFTNGNTNGTLTIGTSAFQGCSKLTSVTTPDRSTSIGQQAFYSCTSLATLTISNTVTSIGTSAFQACTVLKTLTFTTGNNSVELTIGTSAFKGCSLLASVTIPIRCKSIGTSAFQDCIVLATLTFTTGNTNVTLTIGDSAFVGCKLTSITIPSRCTSIGQSAFSGLISNNSITIEGGTSSGLTIAKEAFYQAGGGANNTLTIPTRCTSIGESAFANCSFKTLEFATGGTSLSTLPQKAFMNCINLTSVINLPKCVNNIGYVGSNTSSTGTGVFEGCTKLASVSFEAGSTSDLKIGENTFRGSGLTSISLPSNRNIVLMRRVYENCTKLTTADMSNVKQLDMYASVFNGDSNLALVKFPATIAYIGNSFSNIKNGAHIYYPGKQANLAKYCNHTDGTGTDTDLATVFGYGVGTTNRYFHFIQSITYNANGGNMPSSPAPITSYETNYNTTNPQTSNYYTLPTPTRSGNYAFWGWYTEATDGLDSQEPAKSLNANNSVFGDLTLKAIWYQQCGNNLYWELLDLDNNSTMETLRIFGQGAMWDWDNASNPSPFSGNTAITNIVIEKQSASDVNGPTTIGEYAFYQCSNISSVTLPSTLTSLGSGCFMRCTALQSISIPASVNNIGQVSSNTDYTDTGAFEGCTSLASVSFEAGGTSDLTIGENTFRGTALTSVSLPTDRNIVLMSRAYENCTFLTTADMSSMATNTLTIYANVFNGDSNLELVKFPANTGSVGQSFTNIKDGAHIYYPGSQATFSEVCNGGLSSVFGFGVGVDSRYFHFIQSIKYLDNSGTEYSPALAPSTYETNYTTTTGDTISLPTVSESDAGYYFAGWYTTADDAFNAQEPAKSLNANNRIFGDLVLKVKLYQKCGDDAYWYVDAKNTLHIFGSGVMTAYSENAAPWYADYKLKITKVDIEQGVTTIGNYAFSGLVHLKECVIPSSVTSIGPGAFNSCVRLDYIFVPDTVASIAQSAFHFVRTGVNLYYPGTQSDFATKCTGGINSACHSSSIQFHFTDDATNPVAAGSCGTDLKYAWCPTNNLVYVYGTGVMDSNPWSANAASIKKVVISDGLTATCNNAFQSCTALTSVHLPNTLTNLVYQTFDGCSGLPEIDLPDSITSYGNSCFRRCHGLTKIKIPKSSTSLGHRMFHYCQGLTEVTVPDGVVNISLNGGNIGSFNGCVNLKRVILPSTLTLIGNGSFNNTANGMDVYYDGNSTDFESVCAGGIATQFSNYANQNFHYRVAGGNCGADGDPVQWTLFDDGLLYFHGYGAIRDDLFYSGGRPVARESVTQIIIGEGITQIGSRAFYSCPNATHLEMPDSLEYIGDEAFRECTSLADEITLPIGLKDIRNLSNGCIFHSTGITKFIMPEGMTALNRVLIDNEVKKTVGRPLAGCSNLTECELSTDLNEISYEFAMGSTNLKRLYAGDAEGEIYFSNKVTLFGDRAMLNALGNISKIFLPKAGYGSASFTSLNNCDIYCPYADEDEFKGHCDGNSVGNSFSGSYTIHYNYPGGRCGRGVHWTLNLRDETENGSLREAGTLVIGGEGDMHDYADASEAPWYEYLSSIKKVIVESGVTSIGDNAFRSYTNLESVTFPTGLTTIGRGSFNGCSKLKNFMFPESLKTIVDRDTFSGCSALTEVVIPPNVEAVGGASFLDCNLNNITITGNNTIFGDNVAGVASGTCPMQLWHHGTEAELREKCQRKTIVGTNVSNYEASFINLASANLHYANETTNSALKCGDNLYYDFFDVTTGSDGTKETVHIAGMGSMYDWVHNGTGVSPFNGKANITNLIIDEGATTVGKYAFRNCTGLATVSLPETTLTTLKQGCFEQCGVLTNNANGSYNSISIPGSVTAIDASAFYSCSGLKKINIPTGVTSISAGASASYGGAFESCTALESVDFESGGTSELTIYMRSFRGCTALTSVEIPNRVKAIGQVTNSTVDIGTGAFEGCTSLASVSFEVGGTSDLTIGENTFRGTALKSVSLPSNRNIVLMRRVYENCTKLETADMSNVKQLDMYAVVFDGDSKLALVKFPANIAYIGNSFSSIKDGAHIYYPGKQANLAKYCNHRDGTGTDTDLANVFGYGVGTEHRYFHFIQSITYNANGGTLAVADAVPTTYETNYNTTNTEASDYYTLPTPTRTDTINTASGTKDAYYFAGWYTEAEDGLDDQEPCKSLNANNSVFGDLALKARWYQKCGDKLYWELLDLDNNSTMETLRIFGSGEMYDFAESNENTGPWSSAASGITNLKIDSDSTEIGDNAFAYFPSLSSVNIPDQKVDSIGEKSFANIASSADIYYYGTKSNLLAKCAGGSLSGANTSFGTNDYVFHFVNEDSTNSNKCGDNLPWRLEYTYNNLEDTEETGNLEMIVYYKVTLSPGEPGYDANSLFYSYSEDNRPWYNYLVGSQTQPIRPNKIPSIKKLTITGASDVGTNAFYAFSALKEISISHTVEDIKYFAFGGKNSSQAPKITTITIPNSVTTIGQNDDRDNYGVFQFCSSLAEVIFESGNNLTSIGSETFRDCTSLKSITIPSTVSTIGNRAFLRCSALESVDLPESNAGFTTIYYNTFNGCASLRSINIPNTVKNIEHDAFYGCTALESIALPSGIDFVGERAFQNCSSLNKVTIPATIENCVSASTGMQTQAFSGLASKADIYFADVEANFAQKCLTSVSDVFGYDVWGTANNNYIFHFKCGDNLWYGIDCTATAQENIRISKDTDAPESSSGAMTDWSDGASPFYPHTAVIKSVTIESGVDTIGTNAFSNCMELTTLTFEDTTEKPSTLTKIKDGAFKICTKLAEINLPLSVTTIGTDAFLSCSSLGDVTIPTTTTIGQNAFTGLKSGAHVRYGGKQEELTAKCYDVAALVGEDLIKNSFGFSPGESGGYYFHFIQSIIYTYNDGAEGPELPDTYETNSGETIQLPVATTDIPEGYSFAWCMNDETCEITPITSFVADNTVFGDLHFYSKLKLNIYQITYELARGINHPDNPSTYSIESGDVVFKKPTKRGYKFVAWYTEPLYNNEITGIPQGHVGDVTIYAKWKQNPSLNYWANSKQTLSAGSYDSVTSDTAGENITLGIPGATTWYAIDENIDLGKITILGDVNLVLLDNTALTADSITVNKGEEETNSISIYAQNSEKYYMNNPSAVEEVDHDTTYDYVCSYSMGSVELDPGEGGSGSALGGDTGNVNGNITIYGGNISAVGRGGGAGIGSGASDVDMVIPNYSTITIYEGLINAKGGENAAGIGGGMLTDGGTINILGGRVTAASATDRLAVIGAGANSDGTELSSEDNDTEINLSWKNKTDCINVLGDGFSYSTITFDSNKPFVFTDEAWITGDSAVDESKLSVEGTKLGNFKMIPYLKDTQYTFSIPSKVVLPFGATKYPLGAVSLQTAEGSDIVRPYSINVKVSKVNFRRTDPSTGEPINTSGDDENPVYDEMVFDLVEIETDGSGHLIYGSDSIVYDESNPTYLEYRYNSEDGDTQKTYRLYKEVPINESYAAGIKLDTGAGNPWMTLKSGVYKARVTFEVGLSTVDAPEQEYPDSVEEEGEPDPDPEP